MKTYFPIPGEGAWVLLREFCQQNRGKHYAHRQEAGHTFTKNCYTHGVKSVFSLVLKVSLISGSRKQEVPLSVR